jgi:hypothetical protein
MTLNYGFKFFQRKVGYTNPSVQHPGKDSSCNLANLIKAAHKLLIYVETITPLFLYEVIRSAIVAVYVTQLTLPWMP